jgi:hypothetical protein
VDDNYLFGNDEDIKYMKEIIQSQFTIQDNGPISNLLGIRIERGDEELKLSQRFYAEKLLEEVGMTECKTVNTPAIEEDLNRENSPLLTDRNNYRKLVGCLIYLSNTSRPDIAYAVNRCARRVSEPKEVDLIAAKRVLRYIKGTLDYKIIYKKNSMNPISYSDASYADDVETRKSTSGFVLMMNGGPIFWKSKKQPIVSLSSAESELIALTSAAKEAIWFNRLIKEVTGKDQPFQMLEDNQSTIKFCKNFKLSERTKHIEVRYYFVKEKLEKKELSINYCPTEEMTADILTKPLNSIAFARHRKGLGISAS